MKYQVIVKIGDEKYCGTDCKIKIKIIGSIGETSFHSLNEKFQNNFERGSENKFKIKDVDVGEIECIGLKVKSRSLTGFKDIWLLDYIQVTKKEDHQVSMVTFPYYQWITKEDFDREMIISTNKTCIPQKDSDARTKNNGRSGQVRKASIQWYKVSEGDRENLAGTMNVEEEYDEIDKNVRFSEGKINALNEDRDITKTNETWLDLESKLQNFGSLDSYKIFCDSLFEKQGNIPLWTRDDKWKTDEEYGRQILNGTNPVLVTRCRELPENFPVNDDILNGILTRNLNLEEEMKEGNIYIINHQILEGIPTGEYKGNDLKVAPAICLFYARDDNEFVPIAIQLGQHEANSPIWTPNDAEMDWLLAKLWFKHADVQVHSMHSLLTMTHFSLEPFAVALYRCLPPVHPVYKLLREHLQHVIATNTLIRAKTIHLVRMKMFSMMNIIRILLIFKIGATFN